MEYSYRLNGLDCPACAAKIEAELRQLAGVSEASVNLFRKSLSLVAEGSHAPTLATIRAIVEKYEPEVTVSDEKNLRFRCLGLNCPNCAQAIEQELESLPSVAHVKVNVFDQSISLDSAVDASHLLKTVADIVHRHEPQLSVEIEERSPSAEPANEAFWSFSWPKSREGVAQVLGALFFFLLLLPWYAGYLSQTSGFLLFAVAYLCLGFRVLQKAVRTCLRCNFFDENTLMTLATLGAFGLGEYPEACAVMLFYQIGEFFQAKALGRSRRSIAHLMNLRATDVLLLRDGAECHARPEDIVPGDTILVRVGEKIPVDGTLLSASGTLDMSALTGEAEPVRVQAGDRILSGAINSATQLTMRATHCYQDSTVARILALVEEAQAKKSKTEQYITRFARWYTPLVVGLSAALMLFPPLMGFGTASEWFFRGLVVLLVSCPCALVLSIPLTFCCGIGAQSKSGILVKGGNALEDLAALDTLVLDKTGTLTEGRFTVALVQPVQGLSADALFALASVAESRSLHPIAQSIQAEAERRKLSLPTEGMTACQEFPGEGICANIHGDVVLVGNSRLLARFGVDQTAFLSASCTHEGSLLAIARNGQYLGFFLIADCLRPESEQALSDLAKLGVRRTYIFSGDHSSAVVPLARRLAVTGYRAELLPEDKVHAVEELLATMPKKRSLGFVGDGINDAPVLARADVGIALGHIGSDAALEAADVVLMTDKLTSLASAKQIARQTLRIARQNICFALSVKGLFLLLGAFGLLGMWAAVFGDVGVTMLAVANALRVRAQKNV